MRIYAMGETKKNRTVPISNPLRFLALNIRLFYYIILFVSSLQMLKE